MTLHMMGLLAAMVVAAQDPGDLLGGWDKKPEKAVKASKTSTPRRPMSRGCSRAVVSAEKLGADHLLLAPPLEELGVYYMSRKRSADAELLFRRTLAIREANQGPDHSRRGQDSRQPGDVPQVGEGRIATTRPGCCSGCALVIFEKQGKETPEVARTLHTLAVWQMSHRDDDAAESGRMRAPAIQEKAFGPDSEEAAKSGSIPLASSTPIRLGGATA